jgi:hypothetical protein
LRVLGRDGGGLCASRGVFGGVARFPVVIFVGSWHLASTPHGATWLVYALASDIVDIVSFRVASDPTGAVVSNVTEAGCGGTPAQRPQCRSEFGGFKTV